MDSETSTNETRNDLSEEERNVRIFAIQMLKSRHFIGHFQDRKYVEDLKAYRNLIIIDESEKDLRRDIELVRRRLRNFYPLLHWIGLTGPNFIGAPQGFCIWVEPEEDTFGTYFYKIKNVRFRKNEVIVRVKNVKSWNDTNNVVKPEINTTNLLDNFNWEQVLENSKRLALIYIIWFFTEVLTAENIKNSCTFLTMFFVTGITLFIKGIQFFMEFFLKFMREASIFIKSTTPVLLAVVNLVGKVIGGFYLLIAMIWRDFNNPQPNVRNYNNRFVQNNNRLAIMPGRVVD